MWFINDLKEFASVSTETLVSVASSSATAIGDHVDALRDQGDGRGGGGRGGGSDDWDEEEEKGQSSAEEGRRGRGARSGGRHHASPSVAALAKLRADPATFSSPIPEAEEAAYAKFCQGFKLEAKTSEITTLLSDDPSLAVLQADLVSPSLTHGDFWTRYFYRAERVINPRPSVLVQGLGEDDDEHEELSWGVDDDDDEDNGGGDDEESSAAKKHEEEDKEGRDEDGPAEPAEGTEDEGSSCGAGAGAAVSPLAGAVSAAPASPSSSRTKGQSAAAAQESHSSDGRAAAVEELRSTQQALAKSNSTVEALTKAAAAAALELETERAENEEKMKLWKERAEEMKVQRNNYTKDADVLREELECLKQQVGSASRGGGLEAGSREGTVDEQVKRLEEELKEAREMIDQVKADRHEGVMGAREAAQEALMTAMEQAEEEREEAVAAALAEERERREQDVEMAVKEAVDAAVSAVKEELGQEIERLRMREREVQERAEREREEALSAMEVQHKAEVGALRTKLEAAEEAAAQATAAAAAAAGGGGGGGGGGTAARGGGGESPTPGQQQQVTEDDGGDQDWGGEDVKSCSTESAMLVNRSDAASEDRGGAAEIRLHLDDEDEGGAWDDEWS